MKWNFEYYLGNMDCSIRTKKIDWYDKKLRFEDLPEYKMLVLEQLKTLKVVEVVLFSKDQDKFPEWAPYGSAMKETCSILGIKFQERILNNFIY